MSHSPESVQAASFVQLNAEFVGHSFAFHTRYFVSRISENRVSSRINTPSTWIHVKLRILIRWQLIWNRTYQNIQNRSTLRHALNTTSREGTRGSVSVQFVQTVLSPLVLDCVHRPIESQIVSYFDVRAFQETREEEQATQNIHGRGSLSK